MYGKTHTEEARKKISSSRSGTKYPNLSASMKEYYSKNPMRKPTEQQLANARAASSKKVTDGVMVFESRKACAEFHGIKNVDTVTNRIKSRNFPDWNFV